LGKVIFRLSEPFSSKLGKELQIDIEQSIPLLKLIELLPKEIFEFISHQERLNDNQVSAHILFFRNGQLMKIDDQVNDSDVIRIMLPVTGG
jgi:hypothetical protein